MTTIAASQLKQTWRTEVKLPSPRNSAIQSDRNRIPLSITMFSEWCHFLQCATHHLAWFEDGDHNSGQMDRKRLYFRLWTWPEHAFNGYIHISEVYSKMVQQVCKLSKFWCKWSQRLLPLARSEYKKRLSRLVYMIHATIHDFLFYSSYENITNCKVKYNNKTNM